MAVLFLIPAGHSVARVTVVGIAVAEPKSYRAAIPTLEIYVVRAMLLAVFLPRTHNAGGALRTDKVFSPEFLHHLLIVSAVFHASKVRLFALKAHIVGHFKESKFL